jgi:TonB family protein
MRSFQSRRLRALALCTLLIGLPVSGCASIATTTSGPCSWTTTRLVGPGEPFGEGAFRANPDTGVALPKPTREFSPTYTADAMRNKIMGRMTVDVVVLPSGRVGEVRVADSLDPVHGLDEQGACAASRWTFEPPTLNGEPISVIGTLEFRFTIH